LRVSAAGQRTGVPSSFSTVRPIARLPGVWPRQTASNHAGSSHSTKNAASSMTPTPACPNCSATMPTPMTIARRMARSMAQAMARGTGPARCSVSSMPSGVATRRVVSSTPDFPPQETRKVY
jgi:hypothetical protein